MVGHAYTVVPKLQAAATLNQAAPVQNTWYTVLDTVTNVEVDKIQLDVLTTSETLEVRVVIDGITLVGTVAATAPTAYFAKVRFTGASMDVTTTDFMANMYVPLKGRSVKVEVRKTTANGTGNLEANVTYHKY